MGTATPRMQKKSESGVDAEEFSKPKDRDEFKSTWVSRSGSSHRTEYPLFADALSPAAWPLSFGLGAG